MTPDYYPPSWVRSGLLADLDGDDEDAPRVVWHVPRRGTVYAYAFTRFEAEVLTGELIDTPSAADPVVRYLAVPACPAQVETWTNAEGIARDTVTGWPLFPADQLTLF